MNSLSAKLCECWDVCECFNNSTKNTWEARESQSKHWYIFSLKTSFPLNTIVDLIQFDASLWYQFIYLADLFPSISLHFSCNFFLLGIFSSREKQFKYLEWSSPSLSFSWVPCAGLSQEPSSYLTVSYPKDQLCFLARGEGRAWSDCSMLKPIPWGTDSCWNW